MGVISPSLLGYEGNLKEHEQDIQSMIDAGIEDLHIDVMRPPFIYDKSAFMPDTLQWVYQHFGSKAKLDFHLMVMEPWPFVFNLNRFIPVEERHRVTITIHREAYRYVAGKFADKKYDLTEFKTHDTDIDDRLDFIDTVSRLLVQANLGTIKWNGYISGLALEPGTSVYSISAEMAANADMILLMSVHSGKGGQEYIPATADKIQQAKMFRKPIQVDGGINDKTLADVLAAGADQVVVGSYVTNGKPAEKLEMLQRLLATRKTE
jgi:pentose-5-phosphate-3-epimerase